MKKSDLYKKWGWVLEICEGTNVDPSSCWKYNDCKQVAYPSFSQPPARYSFAVAILEDKPVFVGDTIYVQHSSSTYSLGVVSSVSQAYWCDTTIFQQNRDSTYFLWSYHKVVVIDRK